MPQTIATPTDNRPQPRRRPTFTQWRILFLLMVGPIAAIAAGLLIYADPIARTLNSGPDPAPKGNHLIIRCTGDCP